MKKFRMLSMILCLIMVLGAMILSGCSDEETVIPEEPEVISYDAALYFVNGEYVETGDESLPHLLIEERTIQIPKDENSYMVLLKALTLVYDEGMGTMVTDEIIFNDVYLSEADHQIIVVDLGREGLSGGSLSEALFIGQVVETLLNNETLVSADTAAPTKVQFLVDGEAVESLMGHIDAGEPFTSQLK